MKNMYAVICEKINVKKIFNSYNEARHFMAETKKNWEDQIAEYDYFDERREFFCELYWTIKIEKYKN